MKNAPYILLVFLAISCSTSEVINEPINLKVHAGINHGGIIENTDLIVFESLPPDAYAGAITIGFSAGGRVSLPLKRNRRNCSRLFGFPFLGWSRPGFRDPSPAIPERAYPWILF
jgi:hypothetical protein